MTQVNKNHFFLPYDRSRCTNHRCLLRTNCKRYMALKYDKENEKSGSTPSEVLVTRFEPKNGDDYKTVECEHQIGFD